MSSKALAPKKPKKKNNKANQSVRKPIQFIKLNPDLSESKKNNSINEIKIKHQREKIEVRLKKLGLTRAFEGELNYSHSQIDFLKDIPALKNTPTKKKIKKPKTQLKPKPKLKCCKCISNEQAII